jgi:cation diffusion facilitator family transporter
MNDQERLRIGSLYTNVTLGVTFVLCGVKLLAGLFAHSNAMLADSIHSLSDTVTTVFVLIGLRMGSKPADKEHPYGHARMEAVAAKMVAVLLVLVAIGLLYSSGSVLLRGEAKAPGALALYAAFLSILVQEGLYRYAIAVGKQINSTAIVADAWHHRSDAMSSIGTLVGIFGARVAWPWLDSAAGLVVAVIILKIGGEIYLRAVDELVDRAPEDVVMSALQSASLETPGVVSIGQFKARKNGPRIQVDVEICVNPETSLEQADEIADSVEHNLKAQFPEVNAVMVHIHPADQQEMEQLRSAENS